MHQMVEIILDIAIESNLTLKQIPESFSISFL